MPDSELCQVSEPRGNLAYSIIIGIILSVVAVLLIDYMVVDIIEGSTDLFWVRQAFGVASGNVSLIGKEAWLYLIIITCSIIVGAISIRWYKAALAGLVIPIIAGVSYSIIGMSFGEGVMITQLIPNPVLLLIYTIPAIVMAFIVSKELSSKKTYKVDNVFSRIK